MAGKGGWFTSHILLTLEDNKGVATVGLALLITLFVCMCVLDNTNLPSSATNVSVGHNITYAVDLAKS